MPSKNAPETNKQAVKKSASPSDTACGQGGRGKLP